MRHDFLTRIAGLALLPLIVAPIGCDCDDDDDVIVIAPGRVATDFQSLAVYLDDPVVNEMFRYMPRHVGATPPDITGSFRSTGTIQRARPGDLVGAPVIGDFCFGPAAAGGLEVIVRDPSVVDVGARSFIEGSGDLFTVYTAFKSVQTLDDATNCEIHEVNIYSGRQNADGSLSELWIGQGIVGVLGNCPGILVDDFQVSGNLANLLGDFCGDGDGGPIDPANVLVEVENNLVVDLLVFLDDDTLPTAEVPALSFGSFETRPGFSVYFETLQPIAGQDTDGGDLLMGEIVSGQFPQDPTGAGGIITYVIENQVGTDVFFAPLPLNQTAFDLFSIVNIGIPIPGYPPPPGAGLDCLCVMAPDPEPYVIGYYSYAVPGIIVPEQAAVHFFRPENPSVPFVIFDGPFDLDPLSGTVTLLVTTGP